MTRLVVVACLAAGLASAATAVAVTAWPAKSNFEYGRGAQGGYTAVSKSGAVRLALGCDGSVDVFIGLVFDGAIPFAPGKLSGDLQMSIDNGPERTSEWLALNDVMLSARRGGSNAAALRWITGGSTLRVAYGDKSWALDTTGGAQAAERLIRECKLFG